MVHKNHILTRFDPKTLKTLRNDENSCVTVEENQQHHIALHPFHLNNCKNSVNSILNEIISKYDKGLNGIVLGYENVRLLSDVGELNYDNCFVHVNVLADFYIFRPTVGSQLHGVVNKKSKDHVGCLVFNHFNVSIPKPPPPETEDGDEGDWLGDSTQLGHEIAFTVTYTNFDRRLPYIRGEIISILSEHDSGISTGEECITKKDKKLKRKNNISEEENKTPSKKAKLRKIKEEIQDAEEEQEVSKKQKIRNSNKDASTLSSPAMKVKKSKKTNLKVEQEVDDDISFDDLNLDFQSNLGESSSKKSPKIHRKIKVEQKDDDDDDDDEFDLTLNQSHHKKKKKKKNSVTDRVQDEEEDLEHNNLSRIPSKLSQELWQVNEFQNSTEDGEKKKDKSKRRNSLSMSKQRKNSNLDELNDSLMVDRYIKSTLNGDDETKKSKKTKKKEKIKKEQSNDDDEISLPELNLDLLFESKSNNVDYNVGDYSSAQTLCNNEIRKAKHHHVKPLSNVPIKFSQSFNMPSDSELDEILAKTM